MKDKLEPKTTFLAATILATFSIGVLANETVSLIKEQSHEIYHVVKNKTLLAATNQLANRTGITFKINHAVENDVINQKLAADDWKSALIQLLQGYNYTTEMDRGFIKTVVITGRNGSGHDNVTTPMVETGLVVVEPDFSKKLPGKYKNFNAGSVMNVYLPIKELASIPVGEDLTLDLPIGQYKVKHDDFVDHGDGSSTWIGYLDEEGKGYRVYLSQGDTGVIGNVYTPDGAYNIETVDGQTVIVDLERSGLQSAGFENDDAEPTANALMDAGVKTADDIITDLKAAADSARTKANALAAEAKSLYTKYLQAVTAANNTKNQVSYLNAVVAKAKANLATAQAMLNKSPKSSALKNNVKIAATTLNSAHRALAKAVSTNNSAQKNVATLLADYNKKLAEAKAAEANAKTAEAAYAAQLAKTGSGTSTTTGSAIATVVDLMVLYTTTNQTADYAKQRIQYLVDVSNQAYKDSGINLSLRLVHARPTGYVENNANSQALDDLANDRGAFAGTAAVRNQYGADLVMLFRPLYAQTSDGCGMTYVGFANGGNGIPNFGYGTIGDGYSKDALSSYYCGPNIFTHEIGHSLGNVHDREYSGFAGKYPYSYAWGINGKFGTIMSYYGPSIMLFSTPELATQCAGTPCGFAEGSANSSDQVSTTNDTAPIVGGYKPTTVRFPVIE
ncbi:reprolysin-like metallopeptidase [Methyloglobulus sp.]|uniref:reprolysin-like metallopeptidase n=1 Tax=Methyloglobulus sp. TaxID=2518622 RepID=UPI003989E012